MKNEMLPSGGQLSRRIAFYGIAISVPSAIVVLFNIYWLLDFDASEWRSFLMCFLPIVSIGGGACEVWRRRAFEPVSRWLESRRVETPDENASYEALRALVSMPADFQFAASLTWAVAALGVPLLMTLLGEPGWGLAYRSIVVVFSGLAGALLSSSTLFYIIKRELDPVREEAATEIHDPEERAKRIKRRTISRKISISVTGTLMTLLICSMLYIYSSAGEAVDELALQWQTRMLEALEPRLSNGSLDEAVAALIPERELLAYPITFQIIDATAEPSLGGEDADVQAAILELSAAGEALGTRGKPHQAAVWAWRDLGDERILVSRIPRSALRSTFGSLGPVILGLMIVASGIAWWIAMMIAGDVRRSIDALRNSSERMALGDLQRGRILESEDEFGDLWRSFESMGGALRTTVTGLGKTADRVDETATEIATLADRISAASAEQVQGIQQASELMVSINRQVVGVAGSAQDLNRSVEESSSSILELAAAGDELNETSSVLGNKVDEVSTSIEEMIRSVKQVGASSDGLGEAAAETSASMEEMASAMRAVDTTAEMTAELSRNVVSSAEGGQAKVTQTIGGMETIRDATDVAESVIRGLGVRTKEIGAILDVIDDVADETNLLALNAAIIAAQAGEHGRAFAVVADEIKELADRVLASTKEIGSLIRSVQEESNNAVGAIEKGSRSVASGVEMAAEAGLSLEGITRSSRESGQNINGIVLAVREQTKAASHVVALMDRVRDGVTQIAAASADQDRGNEIVYRSSITMREVAQQVSRTTEEQSQGFGRIRENVEGVREAVENIDGSLQKQSRACSQVAEFLEQVSEKIHSNEDAAQVMGESIRGLVSQAEALREEVARFRI